ncbi:MAG: hypothetical protein AAF170_03110 [Bacteroidota bacterium]
MPDRQLEHAEDGLVDHLRAAIRQNVARREDYRRRGGLRAWLLSAALVAHERSILPFAALLDRQARPFQREGIPILSADLQPMALSPPPGRQLEDAGPMAAEDLATVRTSLLAGIRAARRSLHCNDLRQAARALATVLDAVEAGEVRSGARLALTAHVVESAGVSAANGVTYSDQSGGQTLALSRRFVNGQLLLLPGALRLDALAGPVHARGVPIFIDDVPPVPFREALHQLEASSGAHIRVGEPS